MEYVVNKKDRTLTIKTAYGDLHFNFDVHTGASLINKIDLLQKDYDFLVEHIDTFERDFYDIVKNIHIKSPDEAYSLFKRYADYMIEHKNFNIPSYCDSLKKTKTSIFFDENDMYQVLEMILILKLLSPLTHDTYYIESIKPILRYIVRKYDDVNKRLFQLIKYRLKFDMHDKGALAFLKYAVSDDYLVLYNFEFVLLTAIAFYDTDADMNPVSYIVSVAADNVIYTSMSFSTQTFDYMETLEDAPDTKNLLLEISDQLLITRLVDISKLLLKELKLKLRLNLMPTKMFDVVVVPTLVLLTGITPKYLLDLEDHDKLYLQWLTAQILSRIDLAKETLGDSINLFLFGYDDKYKSNSLQTSQVILKILYNDITYKGLDNRSTLIYDFNDLSVLAYRPMYHLINGKQLRGDVKPKLVKVLQYLLMLLDDKTRNKLVESGRKVVHDILKHTLITERDFKKTFASVRS